MISIELVILLVMLGVFIALLLKAKLPGGLSLMAASVVGLFLGWAIQGTSFELRYLVEGGFGYIDNLFVIVCAMIFIKGLQHSGALDYLTALLVKWFKKAPTILLLLFMALLMLPGMVTGSSTSGVISAGIIVTPIMLAMGMPKKKVAGFVGLGAILGMVAPPINIPVMVICDVVDIAYNGFDIPLLMLTVPCAVFTCLFFSRDLRKKETKDVPSNFVENVILTGLLAIVELFFTIKFVKNIGFDTDGFMTPEMKLHICYLIFFSLIIAASVCIVWLFKPHCHSIDLEKISSSVNFEILKENKWYCLVPFIVIVGLFAAQSIWPKQIGVLATPMLFIIAFIFTLFTGKFYNPLKAVDEAVENSLGVMGLLMGVGMFIEVMTLNGARGYIVINVLSLMTLSKVLLFVALAVSMTIFGGISSFASASIFGGPFVMALYPTWSFIIVASGCSLVAALGEFLPPTAISSKLACKNVNDVLLSDDEQISYLGCTKQTAIPLAVTLTWAMLLIVFVAKFY